ncbi:integrin-linked protein kinase 1 [Populus alba x Populus x berolinensis]|uniref:non-specific serine/threonine protein kinase n=1 Tax=Populus alba x Populus x berolinensis TaxID=444605 RepID=A0AAD6Q807_9ROSI|nr:integrin-linked protein kinase 1 [Populus alba x Populus x berolinensis]
MSSDTPSSAADTNTAGASSPSPSETMTDKQKEKARVSRTSLILWQAHQNDAAAVRKLLEEDPSLVRAMDYDSRTPLHVASLHGWVDVAKCLIDFGADVNAQDRWKNTPLADAEGAKKHNMIELLKSYGGLSYGQNGSHFEPKPVPPPLTNKCDWEIEPSELDFSNSNIIGKDFRHEVNLLVKLRHPNIVQFLGAVTDRKPLMLITEYLRGGDLHQYLKEKGALSPSTAINFALDIARGMAYLHNEPNVIVHRDLKPRNVLLVNSNADHLKVGDFGLSKLVKVQNSHDVYKMTGETGSYRYMAPEVFKHRKYDKKVDVFSFAMILYEMLEGEPPFSDFEPYEAAKYVAEGHRPTFRSKGFNISDLRELTDQCWAADMNRRPAFLEILKRLEKIKENLPTDHHWHLFNP